MTLACSLTLTIISDRCCDPLGLKNCIRSKVLIKISKYLVLGLSDYKISKYLVLGLSDYKQ